MVVLCSVCSEPCKKTSTYCYKSDKDTVFCKDHKIDGMMNKGQNTCTNSDCPKRANFNYAENTKGVFCSACKLDGMVDVVHRKCLLCNRQSIFNYEGETMGLYCKNDKLDGMVDIKKRILCASKGCPIRPSYNFEGFKEKFCFEHSLEGMIIVSAKKCIFPGCTTLPSFNIEGNPKLYCKEHASSDMERVGNKTCKLCKKGPNYNYRGLQPEYCKTHSTKGMMDVRKNKCKYHEGCDKTPIFNFEGIKPAVFCFDHRSKGMVDVKNKKCLHPECPKQPRFNFSTETAGIYCVDHCSKGMINVIDIRKLCKECHLVVAGEKYKGYCVRCFMFKFPNEPNTRNYKTKEITVRDFILEKFKKVEWICDKKVKGGSSRRRPDLYVDMESHILIIEIDENCHKSYDCTCSNKRLMELSQDFDHRPVVFIRFNPDSYFSKDGTKVKSPWVRNAKDIQCIPTEKSKSAEYRQFNKDWNDRLRVLRRNVRYWMKYYPDKTVEVVELYYDQNIE